MLSSFGALRTRHRAFSVSRSLATAKRHQPPPWGRRAYAAEAKAPPPRTQLEKHILDSIKATGPIAFSTYMQFCLSDPIHGYYMNPAHDVFGSRGDFITSPEISQVFGELVGVWFLTQWKQAGMPPAIRLIELGPGRGTLMDDILRVISQITSKHRRTDIEGIHLVETSQPMRKFQEQKLGPLAENAGCRLHWYNDVDEIEPSPAFSMSVAHEFFDALPFYLLQKVEEDVWREVMIASALDPLTDPRSRSESSEVPDTPPTSIDPESIYPRFRRVLSPDPTPATIGASRLSPRYSALPVGSFLEVSPWSHYKAKKLATLLSAQKPSGGPEDTTPSTGGGCGLIIDYGDAKAFGDSFRAFQNHRIVDVFHQPGRSDLTTNVDFALLKEAMRDSVTTLGPISQADFLTKMGITVRAAELARQAKSEERRSAILDAAKRLVDPVGMGKEYKVMGFTSLRNGDAARDAYPFDDSVD
ncbi:hypothetical protein LshimejAT787_0801030 [Lyophyllum shimeji]|uniref:Protein arginine methyltransferase NDUFAF7 n=1 Tax=Lyophyllum shimeji TaxID=47721 RepID=A0A9P3PRV2_LYOSH|nr:hypothetical protein LshimejAT787_0801030 [Lyophyllum shimeji]